MLETLEIGCSPHDEPCVQVISDVPYIEEMREECRRFKLFLLKLFGEPPGDAYLKIVTYPHDFGSYCEVAVRYNPESEKESQYAYFLEANVPDKWDSTLETMNIKRPFPWE
jgi:hypothetical protein